MFENIALEHNSNSGSHQHAVPTLSIFYRPISPEARKDSRVAHWPVTQRVTVVRPLRTMDLHVRTETSSQQRQLKCSLAPPPRRQSQRSETFYHHVGLARRLHAIGIFSTPVIRGLGPGASCSTTWYSTTTFHQTSVCTNHSSCVNDFSSCSVLPAFCGQAPPPTKHTQSLLSYPDPDTSASNLPRHHSYRGHHGFTSSSFDAGHCVRLSCRASQR